MTNLPPGTKSKSLEGALKNGDIWQIGVEIGVNSERTIDLCSLSFLVSQWQCDRFVRFLVTRFTVAV